MYDTSYYETHLSAHLNRKLAFQRRKEAPTLRGVLGVPYASLSTVIAESEAAHLPGDTEEINQLYSRSLEEGLIAIALLSVCVLETPGPALALADRWLPYLDDVQTADSLGQLVVGPACLSLGLSIVDRIRDSKAANQFTRRAEVMSLMAALPEPIRGPASVALRESLNADEVTFVEGPMDTIIGESLELVQRDDSPVVRKAFSNILRVWTATSFDFVQGWLEHAVPDRHPWIKDGLKRGTREYRRRQRRGTP
jgi:hypothetical protein